MNESTQLTTTSLQRKTARYSGIAIILMTIVASFSFGVLDTLVVFDDALLTFSNLSESKTLFMISVIGWGIIVLLDLLVSLTLYLFFRDIDEKLSLIMGGFRFIYTTFLAFALLSLIDVLFLLDEQAYSLPTSTKQLHTQILFLINEFNSIWSIGLILFGVHIFLLGYLVFKSSIPKLLAILLFLASLGYVVVHGGNLLFPSYKEDIVFIESIFMVPMILGEVGLAIWLLIKSSKEQKESMP